jgi:hypothetical protein
MMMQFTIPIPIVTEKGEEGYAIYVESSGMFENDIWCVVLCEGGIIRHFSTSQIKIHKNATFDIKKIQDQKNG